jgi:hypothetical protein
MWIAPWSNEASLQEEADRATTLLNKLTGDPSPRLSRQELISAQGGVAFLFLQKAAVGLTLSHGTGFLLAKVGSSQPDMPGGFRKVLPER